MPDFEIYHEIFQNSPNPFILGHPDGSFIRANPAACALFGYTETFLLEKGRNGILKIDDLESLQQIRKENGHFTVEVTGIKNTGEEFPVEFCSWLLNKGAETEFTANLIRDISVKQRTENQLRKVTQAVEQSSASVVITNVEGNVEYVNPAFTRLTGYTFEEILGKNPRILKTGHTTDQEYKVLWDNLTQTKEWQGEFCNRKKNGDIYWENAIISPIVNNEGIITHYVAVKENITERKHLLDKQNELIKMIENTDAFFATVDLNRNFLYGNPSLRKKLGIREEEDISMLNLSQFITPKAREMNKEMNEIIMKEGKWTGENSYQSRDGIEIPVWQVIILHKNEKGIPTHISSTAIDLSKNKEAEKELFRLNNELRELSNHLQTINETDKKEIAKEIHDELGQGLTSLKFNVYWIKKHLMDDKAIIEKKLDELLAEISGAMVSFRRIYTALNPSLLEEVGLKSSVDWLIDTFTRSENIQVKFDTNTENIQFNLDKSLTIYRIIQESLNNIMRYANATSVDISLLHSESGYISLTISDNGIGFDINALDSKKHHGLLGIRERVYALKGKLNLHSELNKGTLIEVEIPLN